MYKISNSVLRPYSHTSFIRTRFYVCPAGCVNTNRRAGRHSTKKQQCQPLSTTANSCQQHLAVKCFQSCRQDDTAHEPGHFRQTVLFTPLFQSPQHALLYRNSVSLIQKKPLHWSCTMLNDGPGPPLKKPEEEQKLKLIDELQDEDSKVEDTLQREKGRLAKKKIMKSSSKDFQKPLVTDRTLAPVPREQVQQPPVVPKKFLVKIKEIAMHYWNGFKLLGLDTVIAGRYLWKRYARGKNLTRRESKQLQRTLSDLFRLVPFSVFLIVPFMEFLLPFAIRLFPGLLPSTFEDAKSREAKRRASLKVKLEMVELLQDTIEEIAVVEKGKKTHKDKLAEFKQFVEKSRNEADPPTNVEILKFSKLFEDEITLDNIPYENLLQLARIIMLPSFLDFVGRDVLIIRIRWKLNQLKLDDKVIRKEGIDSLNNEELQNACIARGMRAFGVPADRLRSSLHQWLELSLDREIPISLLLLSRTFYFPSDEHLDEQLKAAIRQLPERLIDEVEVKIGAEEREHVDQQTRLDIIKHEEEQIQHEKELRLKMKAEEEMRKARNLIDSTVKKEEAEHFSKEELIQVKETLSVASVKEKLDEIKAEREEYIADIQELKLIKKTATESTASKRLGKRIDAMLKKIEKVEKRVGREPSVYPKIDEDEDGIVTTDELVAAINRLPNGPDLERAQSLVANLDEDCDGVIDLEEMRNAVRIIHTESLKELSQVQINEVLTIVRGLEQIVINDQRINKRKSNYIFTLFPIVYQGVSIENFPAYASK